MKSFTVMLALFLVSASLVQGQAPNVIGPLPSRSLVELLETIRNPTRSIDRVQAAEEIAGFGSHAVSPLTGLLTTHDSSIQSSVLLALRRIGAEASEAVPAVILIAVDSDHALQIMAIEVLGAIGRDSAETVPALAALLPSRSEERRYVILNSLLLIGDDVAHQAMADVYKNGDRTQQLAVLRSLREFPESTAALMPLLVDEYVQGHSRFESQLLQSISRSPEHSIPHLLESLQSGTAEQRRRALIALSQPQVASTGAEAVGPLIESLQDSDPVVRFWALQALGAIGLPAQEASSRIIACFQDSDADVRWRAIETVQQLGLARQAAGPLQMLRADPNPAVRKAAEEAVRSTDGVLRRSS